MRNTIFEEDRLLAKAAGTPSENKPRFDWAEANFKMTLTKRRVPKIDVV